MNSCLQGNNFTCLLNLTGIYVFLQILLLVFKIKRFIEVFGMYDRLFYSLYHLFMLFRNGDFRMHHGHVLLERHFIPALPFLTPPALKDHFFQFF